MVYLAIIIFIVRALILFRRGLVSLLSRFFFLEGYWYSPIKSPFLSRSKNIIHFLCYLNNMSSLMSIINNSMIFFIFFILDDFKYLSRSIAEMIGIEFDELIFDD